MTAEERLLAAIARGIIQAGGAVEWEPEAAMALAREVLAGLRAVGQHAYPSMVQMEDLRFVYQWDQRPPLLTVMRWDDIMWRDMARFPVPPDVI